MATASKKTLIGARSASATSSSGPTLPARSDREIGVDRGPAPASARLSVLALSREVRSVVAAIEKNDSLYVLDLGDDRYALFRVDGLTVALDRILYEFLSDRSGSVSDRVRRLGRAFGPEATCESVESLLAVGQNDDLFTTPPPLVRSKPGTAQPGGILILVTQTCNLRCTYCYAGDGSYGGQQKLLRRTDARRVVDLMLERAPDRDRFVVTFFGGEPLLNFRLVREVVEYCSQKSRTCDSGPIAFRYNITTNGTLATDEICSFMRDHDFNIMVSFDGVPQRQNRPFANGVSSYDAVTKNIRKMISAGLSLDLRGTMASHDQAAEASVRDFVKLGRSLGAKRVMLSPADGVKNDRLENVGASELSVSDISGTRETYRKIALENLEEARSGGNGRALLDPYFVTAKALATGRAVGMGQCGAGFGMVAASTDGNLYPCHRFVGMEDYQIGSVDSGVDDQRLTKFFQDADAANAPECGSCFARQICGGFCFYHVADGEGGFVGPSRSECDGVRDGLKFSIRLMMEMRELDPVAARQYRSNMRSL